MLLVIEVFLTSKALKNGWRYWAFVPWALMVAASLTVATTPGAADVIDIPDFGILLDVLLIGVLVYMSMRERDRYVPRPAGAPRSSSFETERD